MPKNIVPVGSLVAIQNQLRPGHALGLVVNQEAGQRWVKRDPFPPQALPDACVPVLVRLLGLNHEEAWYSESDQLWGQEPSRVQTVRWAYVRTDPNPPWVIAGPDTFSIEKFFGACKTCEALGMSGATFLSELQILLGHLKGHAKPADDMSIFERRYRAMLADVLPRSL